MSDLHQLELFPAREVQRTEPFRLVVCARCEGQWLTPDISPYGATYAVCPECSAVVMR